MVSPPLEVAGTFTSLANLSRLTSRPPASSSSLSRPRSCCSAARAAWPLTSCGYTPYTQSSGHPGQFAAQRPHGRLPSHLRLCRRQPRQARAALVRRVLRGAVRAERLRFFVALAAARAGGGGGGGGGAPCAALGSVGGVRPPASRVGLRGHLKRGCADRARGAARTSERHGRRKWFVGLQRHVHAPCVGGSGLAEKGSVGKFNGNCAGAIAAETAQELQRARASWCFRSRPKIGSVAPLSYTQRQWMRDLSMSHSLGCNGHAG